jgi:tetratricopeptide (TPR) repeat protein
MQRVLFLLCLLFPFSCFAQDITALLRQAGELESSFSENEAFLKYQELLRTQPRNLTALIRCSDLSCRIGNRLTDQTKKTGFFKAGRSYAQAAYQLAPANSEANIVMAFSIARMALIQSGRDKVSAAGDVKKYAENAIRCDPSNFKGYHILGRWHYEVSALNIVERTLAKWFFGALPAASLKESIANYEKSMSLAPGFLLNYLELARACHRDGQKDRALRLLRQMDSLPDGMLDDARVREEGKKLLAAWN